MESWLADRLAGLTFHSMEALTFAATRHFELVRGSALTEDEQQLIQRAANSVWCGLAARARTALEINERGLVESLHFRAA